MRRLAWLVPALLLASPASSVPTTGSSTCAVDATGVPAFTLEDINPNSDTFGSTDGVQEHLGQPVLLYFAVATCGVCQSHVAQLQEVVDDNPEAFADVYVAVVDSRGYEDYIDELVGEDITLPVLQDTTTDGVFDAYGASKWYLYVIDAEGELAYLHYSFDIDGDTDRLLTELSEAAR